MIKEYKFSKTAAKTAKENNLIKQGNNLYDFSLLDELNLTEWEKQYIIDHAIKYVSAAFRDQFYGKEYNNYTRCDGEAIYFLHAVYTNGTKRAYNILQLYAIKHYTGNRKSVFDQYYNTEEKKVIYGNGCIGSIYDLRRDIDL